MENRFLKCIHLLQLKMRQDFICWYEKTKGKRVTGQKKATKIDKFFRDTGLTLSEVDMEQREIYKAYLLKKIEDGKIKKNYASTILTDLNVFFCDFLQREDLHLSTVKKEPASPERLTRTEFDKMLAEVDKRNSISIKKKMLQKALLVFFWNELPRTSEGTTNILLKDVHFNTQEVRLRSGKRDKLPERYQKAVLTLETERAIREYLPYRDTEEVSGDSPLFVQVGKNGRPVSVDFMRDMVKHYAAAANIDKRVFPYLFRKSAGTELGMKNIGYAQKQLGHTTAKTTLDHYFIPNNEDKKAIDSILRGDKKMSRKDLIYDIVKQYTDGDSITEKEFLFALHMLRKRDEENAMRGDFDVSIA